MKQKPMNLLFIFSDEHSKDLMGCSGHPVVKTPHLDRLAASGIRFTNAYTPCPICVPARASLATGQYAHRTGNWDNAAPYYGKDASWGHRLIEQGYHVESIGKLHYRSDQDDNGFTESRMPLNVIEGEGDVYSLVRDNMEVRPGLREAILNAGAGDTSYIRYDYGIAEEACHFMREEADQLQQPWVLFVSFVTPHFPLIVPEKYFNMYPLDDVVFPKQYSREERSNHPFLVEMRRHFNYSDEFADSEIRKAVAAYYGLCSFLDARIGQVLQTLEETGLSKNTRVIYTSDHGDTIGDHGMWFKSTMYEGSVGVPMIMAGPDLPASKVVETPVSLIDCFPTVLDAVGAAMTAADQNLPGQSLFSIAEEANNSQRIVFSEYHAAGAMTGVFMIRSGKHKYIEYTGLSPQLFNLEADPDESIDLANDPQYADIIKQCAKELRSICEPDEVNRLVKSDQAVRLEQHGGREAILNHGPKIAFSPTPEKFNL